MHLSHRLERGRSPVYCFGPGPYHLPGRQPNSACRSADHLFAWEPFAPFELPWTCRLCWGKEGAQALHFGRRNGRPLPVLRSQGTHNMYIYIHIYIHIHIYTYNIYICVFEQNTFYYMYFVSIYGTEKSTTAVLLHGSKGLFTHGMGVPESASG